MDNAQKRSATAGTNGAQQYDHSNIEDNSMAQAAQASLQKFPITLNWDEIKQKYGKRPDTQGQSWKTYRASESELANADNVGVVIPAGRILIDLDTYKGVTREAVDEALGVNLEWFPALVQKTISGGEHYCFTIPDGVDVRQGDSLLGVEGFDTRSAGRGWIATGDGYDDRTMIGMPEALFYEDVPQLPIEAIEAINGGLSSPNAPAGETFDLEQAVGALPLDGIDLATAKSYLAKFSAKGETHDSWLKVGFATHHQFHGSDEAKALFVEWSRDSEKFNEAEIDRRWPTFSKRDGIAQACRFDYVIYKANAPKELPAPKAGQPFTLSKFSLTGKAETMKAQMMDDTFVLDGIAIAGQMTALYAKPNAGKTLITLKLLIDSIERGDVDASKVFYINADDNYKGLVTKLEIAEKHGFQMLAPGHGAEGDSFNSSDFADYLAMMVRDGTANGCIVVLDTLKKFMDLMDKRAGTEFLKMAREFVSHNGTIIMLAHTNKHRGNEGELIYAGTSDVVDDIDCAFMIDALEPEPMTQMKTIVLENFKSRGAVVDTASYEYSAVKGQDYPQLLTSVTAVTGDEATRAADQGRAQKKLEDNREIIEEIQEALSEGALSKRALEKAVHENSGIARRAFNKVLKAHTGENWLEGARWTVSNGEKGAQMYSAFDGFGLGTDDWEGF